MKRTGKFFSLSLLCLFALAAAAWGEGYSFRPRSSAASGAFDAGGYSFSRAAAIVPAAVRNVYVDPDAAGAGTGANWANAYTSLLAAEAGSRDNLVAADVCLVFHLRSSEGTADATAEVTFAAENWTTDAAHTITVQTDAADRHSGAWDNGKYRLTPSSNNKGLKIYVPHMRIYGLQIKTSPLVHYKNPVSVYTRDVEAAYCILTCASSGITYGIYVSSEDASNVCLYNNIIYGADYGIFLDTASAGDVSIFNNSVHASTSGIYSAAGADGAALVVNNLCAGAANDFTGTFAEGSDYNFSVDARAPGAHSIHGTADAKTIDFVSTASGSEDLRLQSTSDAIGAGTSLAVYDLFTDDIAGTSRGTVWDMGAWEYAAP